MKKVSLLILIAILISSLFLAAIPTKMVRLTVINKSGYDVYMKLEGSPVTEAYYYLTIPAGDRSVPYIKVFTIMEDLYTRTTWQCDGAKSSGTLIVDGNIRLTFIPCGEKACAWELVKDFGWVDPCTGATNVPADWVFNPATGQWECPVGEICIDWGTTHRHAGEPRMEKVTYFQYLQYGAPSWVNAYLYTGFWNFGCGTWYYRLRSYRLPYGCAWRYQY
jgi:hypothetical protein